MTAVPNTSPPRWWQRAGGVLLIIAGLAVAVLIVLARGSNTPHGWVKAAAAAILAATIPVGLGLRVLRLPRRRGYLIGLIIGWLPGIAVAGDAIDSIVEPSLWLSGAIRGNHTIIRARASGFAGLFVAAVALAFWVGAIYLYRHPDRGPAARRQRERSDHHRR